jgi:hypothetical protein
MVVPIKARLKKVWKITTLKTKIRVVATTKTAARGTITTARHAITATAHQGITVTVRRAIIITARHVTTTVTAPQGRRKDRHKGHRKNNT